MEGPEDDKKVKEENHKGKQNLNGQEKENSNLINVKSSIFFFYDGIDVRVMI